MGGISIQHRTRGNIEGTFSDECIVGTGHSFTRFFFFITNLSFFKMKDDVNNGNKNISNLNFLVKNVSYLNPLIKNRSRSP